MKNLAFTSLIMLLFFAGCEKKEFIRSSTIIIGNNTNLHVSNVNANVSYHYNTPKTVCLDLNNDKKYDIKFTSYEWGSSGMGIHYDLDMIITNPNLQVMVKQTIDTLFYKKVTTSYTDNDNKLHININHYYFYSGTIKPNHDSIIKISSNNKLCLLNKGEQISLNTDFNSDDVKLYESPKILYQYYSSGADTIYHINTINFPNLPKIPYDTSSYIGFKFNNSNKLGWIKIRFNNQPLYIDNTAIQL